MIRQIMNRATKEPMNFAAAMAAGAFGPRILTTVLNQGGIGLAPMMTPMMMAVGSGAATFYLLDDAQDTTSMIVGAGAGYLGPMVSRRLMPQMASF